MKRKIKMSLAILMSLVLCLSGTSNVSFALESSSISNEQIGLEKADISALSSETIVYLPNFSNALYYYTTLFSQSQNGNNCGPTAANVLSYYKGAKGLNLYSGNITQSVYNQICTDCNYSSSGGLSLQNISNGIKIFANRAGYSCDVDVYWMNLFSDVKRDIGRGYPVLLIANSHAYVIFGYSEGGSNGNCIYACTGWENPIFEWYKFSSGQAMCSINIY